MPAYDKAFHNTRCSFIGHAVYLFGNLNVDASDCIMQVTQVSGNGTTATLSVTVRAGNIPAAGNLVTVRGLANSGFNTTGTALSAVSINADSGVGTISYANATSLGATADAGRAVVPIQETTESLANGASIAAAVLVNDPQTNSARTVTLVVNTPANTITGTVTAQLQEAITDQDSEYQSVGASISIPTTAQVKLQSITLQNGRFYRLLIAGVTGGSGTIVAKILF